MEVKWWMRKGVDGGYGESAFKGIWVERIAPLMRRLACPYFRVGFILYSVFCILSCRLHVLPLFIRLGDYRFASCSGFKLPWMTTTAIELIRIHKKRGKKVYFDGGCVSMKGIYM